MFIVIIGGVSDSNHFFGPFTSKDEADIWAREYSIQHAKAVEVVLLLKQFDLDA